MAKAKAKPATKTVNNGTTSATGDSRNTRFVPGGKSSGNDKPPPRAVAKPAESKRTWSAPTAARRAAAYAAPNAGVANRHPKPAVVAQRLAAAQPRAVARNQVATIQPVVPMPQPARPLSNIVTAQPITRPPVTIQPTRPPVTIQPVRPPAMVRSPMERPAVQPGMAPVKLPPERAPQPVKAPMIPPPATVRPTRAEKRRKA